MVLHEDGRLQVQRVSLIVSGLDVGRTDFVRLLIVEVRVLEAALLEQRGRAVDVRAVEVSLVEQTELDSGGDVFRSQLSADRVGASLDEQSKTLHAGHGLNAVGLGESDAGVGVHEALEAHDVTEQGRDDLGVVSRAQLLDLDVVTAIALRGRTIVSRIAGVARHDRADARIDSSLEADQLVLLEGALGRVQTPLTLRGVGLKAVLRRAVAREVLGRENNGVLVHAFGAILIAVNQRGDDARGDVRTLAVGAVVARPARVGHQVDLRAIHEDDALRAPHLAIDFSVVLDSVVVAVAQNSRRHAQRIREAGRDRVGDEGHRNRRGARLSGIPLGVSGGHVVVQRNNGSIEVQTAAIHARANLADGHHLIVKARKGRRILLEHVQALGGRALRNHGHDLRRIDGAVLVLDLSQRLGDRLNHQRVEDEASLLGQGHLGDHVRRAGLGVLTPILENIQFVVVVEILEVQTILLDDANGGHTDGRAVFILVVNRLQIGLGRIDFLSIVRSRDVLGAALCQRSGDNACQHSRCQERAQNPLHANSPFPFVPNCQTALHEQFAFVENIIVYLCRKEKGVVLNVQLTVVKGISFVSRQIRVVNGS